MTKNKDLDLTEKLTEKLTEARSVTFRQVFRQLLRQLQVLIPQAQIHQLDGNPALAHACVTRMRGRVACEGVKCVTELSS